MSVMTEQNWRFLLLRCGVAVGSADRWAKVFAQDITPSTFSAGWKTELPDFLGNILHESNMLSRLEEDLFYTTPQRLMAVWPSRFKSVEQATPYLKNPKKLADFVYGSRLGNVNGDGYTYRGSGLIMVTGLDNFKVVEKVTGKPVVVNPDTMRQPDTALEVALAWWENKVPDAVMGDRKKVRRSVNGGLIGYADTFKLSNLAEATLNTMPV